MENRDAPIRSFHVELRTLAVAESDIHQRTCILPHRKIGRDKVVRMFHAVVRMFHAAVRTFHAVVAIEEVRKNF